MTLLLDLVDEALQFAVELTAGHTAAKDLSLARERLREPLRVAIAGRVKAGKSTLLNAVVGERLAKTDASECTQVVTWYRYGDRYSVDYRTIDGRKGELRFDRNQGRLDIHLDGRDPAELDDIEVRWPARRLTELTLVDTPGMESTAAGASERTRRFFSLDEEAPGRADAVIYLMRHLHASDVSFLETFLDRSVAQPSPFNAIGVLSRADELGAGRLDAMASARAVADRFAEDRRVRSLCSGVVAVAGLLAETGVTLIEDEMAALRAVARSDPSELEGMLLSVDRFRDPAVSDVSSQQRGHLLDRFGLFGLRFALQRLETDPGISTPELSNAMVEESGLPALLRSLADRFGPRAEVLKSRSALAEMLAVAAGLSRDDAAVAGRISARVEAIEAASTELSELRLWQLVSTGEVELTDDEVEEVRNVVSSIEPAVQLGLDPNTPRSELANTALIGVERWRTKASHPLSDRSTQEVGELVARSFESVYARLADRPG